MPTPIHMHLRSQSHFQYRAETFTEAVASVASMVATPLVLSQKAYLLFANWPVPLPESVILQHNCSLMGDIAAVAV